MYKRQVYEGAEPKIAPYWFECFNAKDLGFSLADGAKGEVFLSKKNILIEPDPILRKKSQSLEKVDDDLRKLMDEMLETMYAAPGIGLAAVQIGILKRLIVIDISKDDQKKEPLFLVNPKITFQSKKTSVYEEGCLSLPGHFAEIERPAECHVSYVDYSGKNQELKASGLLATCLLYTSPSPRD